MPLCLFNFWGYDLVIAVYWPPGLNVKFFVDYFTILFEKRLQFDEIDLLGDFNISQYKQQCTGDVELTFESFSLMHYFYAKRIEVVGYLTMLERQCFNDNRIA